MNNEHQVKKLDLKHEKQLKIENQEKKEVQVKVKDITKYFTSKGRKSVDKDGEANASGKDATLKGASQSLDGAAVAETATAGSRDTGVKSKDVKNPESAESESEAQDVDVEALDDDDDEFGEPDMILWTQDSGFESKDIGVAENPSPAKSESMEPLHQSQVLNKEKKTDDLLDEMKGAEDALALSDTEAAVRLNYKENEQPQEEHQAMKQIMEIKDIELKESSDQYQEESERLDCDVDESTGRASNDREMTQIRESLPEGFDIYHHIVQEHGQLKPPKLPWLRKLLLFMLLQVHKGRIKEYCCYKMQTAGKNMS